LKHTVSLFITLFSFWLLWSGHYTSLLITLGLFSCFFVLLVMRRMQADEHGTVPVAIALRGLRYLPWLLLEIARSNIDVARRVLQPTMSIRPHVIQVRASQRSDLTRVIYANSITLTPGTVTIGISGDDLTVHALTDAAAEGVLSGEMDRRVTALEAQR